MNQLLDISDAKSSLSDYLVENVVTLKGHADFKVEAQAQAGTQRADLTHESAWEQTADWLQTSTLIRETTTNHLQIKHRLSVLLIL